MIPCIMDLVYQHQPTRDVREHPRQQAAMPALFPVAGRATASEPRAEELCFPVPGGQDLGIAFSDVSGRPPSGNAGMAAGRQGGRTVGHLGKVLLPGSVSGSCCLQPPQPATPGEPSLLLLHFFLLKIVSFFMLIN
jgi:hypothetical protein